MSELNRWWSNLPDERYWLEVTDREDPGTNLKAPQTNEAGDPFWSYNLVKDVRPGDVVFHYDRLSQAVIAYSECTGDHWEDRLVWGARGTYARAAGVLPHVRPGFYTGLRGFTRLGRPLELVRIRDGTAELQAAIRALRRDIDGPLYFPFELGENRPIRPIQGYLFKLPRAFVDLFPELRIAARETQMIPLPNDDLNGVGAEYRPADEEASVGAFDPLEVDPAIVERGTRGHAVTQNAVADHVDQLGYPPRSPRADEPNFDVAWEVGDTLYVAEVKSTTNKNELSQLRHGLGQVLQYRHALQMKYGGTVVAVLACERKPPRAWIELCESLGVKMVWPGDFSRLT